MNKILSIVLSFALLFSITRLSVSASILKIVDFETVAEEVAEIQKTNVTDEEAFEDFTERRIIVNADKKPPTYKSKDIVEFGNNTYIYQFSSSSSADEAMQQLKKLNYVNWVEVDAVMETQSLSYGNDMLGSDSAKEYITTNSISTAEINVAVIDCGINFKSPSFKDSGRVFDSGINLSSDGYENSSQATSNLHGSNISSIILDNTTSNVNIIGYKIANSNGKSTKTALATAINIAVEDGCDVINISLGGKTESQLVYTAVKDAYDNGVVIVCSAGNNADDTENYEPACFEEVFTVAAMDERGNRAFFSNFGQEVDFIAPGYKVEVQGGNDDVATGTSFSSPFVAAVSAMALSVNPTMQPDEVKEILIESCIEAGDINFESQYYTDIDVSEHMGTFYQVAFAENESLYYGYGFPQMEYVVGKSEKCKSPVLSAQSGTYNDDILLTITANEDESVYYTIDGRYPSINDKLYIEPILITETCCIRAIAFSDTKTKSIPTMKEYKLEYFADERDFTVDERGYITGYTGDKKEFIVPDTINGVVVCGIADSSFYTGMSYEDLEVTGAQNDYFVGIVLPQTATEIESFGLCNPVLKYVTAPGLTNIGEMGLKSSTMYLDAPNIQNIEAGGLSCKLSEINLNMLTYAAEGAFFGNNFLEKAFLPNITIAKYQLFEECRKLHTIEIPKVTKIENGAFYKCFQLRSITLDNVEKISFDGIHDSYPFGVCVSLTSINAPKLKNIEAPSAFFSCKNLSYVNMPELLSISDKAFVDCQQLETFIAPKLQFVGDQVFMNTTSLKFLQIPAVTTMGNAAFKNSGTKTMDFVKLETLGFESEESNILQNAYVTSLEFSSVKNIYELPHDNIYTDIEPPVEIELSLPSTLEYCVPAADYINDNNKTFMVYGTQGTYAEQWAAENSIPFYEISQETAIREDIDTYWDKYSWQPLEFDARGFNRTYQWYGSTDDIIGNDTPIIGATDKSFNPDDNKQYPYYYCVMNSKDIDVDGNIVSEVNITSDICQNRLHYIYNIDKTTIDYSNLMIFTHNYAQTNIDNIVGIKETTTYYYRPSYIYRKTQYYGTGSTLDVCNDNGVWEAYTLIVQGDVNGDSVCDVIDAFEVQRASTAHTELTDNYLLAADTNFDGQIDVTDYAQVVNMAVSS